jgi:hypothetical protein
MRANAQAVGAVERAPIAPVAQQARLSSASVRQVASGERSNFDTRFAPAQTAAHAAPAVPGRVEPVSAYAAPVSAQSQGSVMTGRGLY